MWCEFVPFGPRNGRIPHPVKKTDNDFVLLDALPIEVFPDHFREIFLGLSSVF